VARFDQALGDCPVMLEDERLEIGGVEARRVKGCFGVVKVRIPQDLLSAWVP
jgi:hypothetical protein